MVSFELSSVSRCLTPIQQVLLELGTPILEDASVIRHKREAKLQMLWQAVRWPMLAIAVLLVLESLGGDWRPMLRVGGAGVALIASFTWLVSAVDLRWSVSDYADYEVSNKVPANVAALASALTEAGISSRQLHVEHLKNDPIFFVQEENSSCRYDLVIW